MNRLFIPKAVGMTLAVVAATTFCSVQICPLQASVPLLLFEMAAAATLSPPVLPLPLALLHGPDDAASAFSPALLLALASAAAGTK